MLVSQIPVIRTHGFSTGAGPSIGILCLEGAEGVPRNGGRRVGLLWPAGGLRGCPRVPRASNNTIVTNLNNNSHSNTDNGLMIQTMLRYISLSFFLSLSLYIYIYICLHLSLSLYISLSTYIYIYIHI